MPSAILFSPWLFGLGSFVCTLCGGLVALRLGRRVRFLTGLSAGAVVGLALFKLIPEAAELRTGPDGLSAVMLAVGVGFCLYMVVEHWLQRLGSELSSRHLGAASLTMHSFMDGLGIGLGFKVSPGVGLAVAIAVIAHDLCDGVNTVSVALLGETRQARRVALAWLLADAAAPLVGVTLASLAPVAPTLFTPLAAGFAGAFLYIGAVELLPRTLSGWRGPLATLPAVTGVAFIYAVSNLTP